MGNHSSRVRLHRKRSTMESRKKYAQRILAQRTLSDRRNSDFQLRYDSQIHPHGRVSRRCSLETTYETDEEYVTQLSDVRGVDLGVQNALNKLSDDISANMSSIPNPLQTTSRQQSSEAENLQILSTKDENREPADSTMSQAKEDDAEDLIDGIINIEVKPQLNRLKEESERPSTGDTSKRITVDKTKVNVAFCGFVNCGKTSLIRSITGEVATALKTLKKSKSQHFTDVGISTMIPFHFKNHLDDVVLWEVSYPFDHALQHTTSARKELRRERMKEFFTNNQLQLFSIIFICIDSSDIKEEDIVFAREVHEQGMDPVFINTKCDERLLSYCKELNVSNNETNRKEFLDEERMVFDCQLMCQAPELKKCRNFYINSRSASGLCKVLAGCEENNNDDVEVVEKNGCTVENNWREYELEERKLLSFIQDSAPDLHFGHELENMEISKL